MTTRVTVTGALSVITVLHTALGGSVETTVQASEQVDEAHEATFPIHNTLSLRVEDGTGSVKVHTSHWPVEVEDGDGHVVTVEPGQMSDFPITSGSLTFREAQPAAAEESAE